MDAAQLREVLDYCPETGIFTWKVNRRRIREGDTAGAKRYDGYTQIKIDQVLYPAHRLAWLCMTGTWPKYQIDHVNCERSDNRFCNLREATQTQNNGNARISRANTSGLKGVSWHKLRGRWRATIRGTQRHMHLGLFATKEEAARAYAEAAKEKFGEFARW